MISKLDYCAEVIKSLNRAGGEAAILRMDSTDPLRGFIYVEIDEGDTLSGSKISGRVVGIQGGKDSSPFEGDCFDQGCYQSMGIWTEAIPDTSNIFPISKAYEDSCFSEECFAPFNPVCKQRLPFDREGPDVFIDSYGKYRLVDVTAELCNQPPSPSPSRISTDPFIASYLIEGSRVLNTYTLGDITIAIEESQPFMEGCFNDCAYTDKYYAYTLGSCFADCFDECSISQLIPIGIYDNNLNPIIDIFTMEGNNLYNDINIIDDDFMSGDGFYRYDFLRYTPGVIGDDLDEYSRLTLLALDLNKRLMEMGQAPVQELLYYKPPRNDALELGSCNQYCVEERVVRGDGTRVRYRRVNGRRETWIEGLVDESGGAYVADIGFLHPITMEPIIWEENVPIKGGGRFQSKGSIPPGVKIVKIKRTSPDDVRVILHHLTGYLPLMRNHTSPLLLYNSKDQEVLLEDLSISIIELLLSGYRGVDPCSKRYSDVYLDPDIFSIIERNIERLTSLMDSEGGERLSTIPQELSTYTEYGDLYGAEADLRYSNRVFRPFEDLVFSEDCFQAWENNTLTSREVSNRAMAWFLYCLCVYQTVTTSKRYLSLAEDIGLYLIGEIDRTLGLVRQGWTHSDIYTDSQPIEDYHLSTSVVACLALLKLHDLTLDSRYIDRATDIYQSIHTYLYVTGDLTYYHSYDDLRESLDSMIYGLMLSTIGNKVEAAEELLRRVKARTKPVYTSNKGKLLVSSTGKSIRDRKGTYYATHLSPRLGTILSTDPSSIVPIHTVSSPEVDSPWTGLKYLAIGDAVFSTALRTDYDVGFFPIVERYKEEVHRVQVANRYFNSSVNAAHCLNSTLIDHPLFKNHSVPDMEVLIFHRSLVLDKIKNLIPVDFTWPSERAVSPSGNIGKLIQSIARVGANWYVGYRRMRGGISIGTAQDIYLERWGEELGIPRRMGEHYDSYKDRLRRSQNLTGITEEGIVEGLDLLGIKASISKTPILAYTSFIEGPYSSGVGLGFYQGVDSANASTIEITSQGALPSNIDTLMRKLKSTSTRVKYREDIQIDGCISNKGESYLAVTPDIGDALYGEICCLGVYRPDKRYPLTIRIREPYPFTIYIKGEIDNSRVKITLHREVPSRGMLGFFRAGELNKLVIIPPYYQF